jgi:hypothetical protein
MYLGLVSWVPQARANGLDAVKTALGVVAGLGVGAALYVNYRKQRNDEVGGAREHDRLFTDRYTKAAEQLGHPAAAVRLAGMYAIARIADDSERDRSTCLEVICGYLRMPYDPMVPDADPLEGNVRLTAQRLLEERLRPDHPGFWDEADVDLTGACLIDAAFTRCRFRKAQFIKARFHGATLVSLADFTWRTWFDGAHFFDTAWFGFSNFHNQSSFKGTEFHGEADFHGARFGGDVVVRFTGATFHDRFGFEHVAHVNEIDFSDAEFSSTHSLVWSEGCSLIDGKLEPASEDEPMTGGRGRRSRLRRGERNPGDCCDQYSS